MHEGGLEAMTKQNKLVLGAASAIGAGIAVAALASRAPYSFRHKSVLITGGSRGLGLVMARQFAKEGARLTLVSRNGETLIAAEREIAAIGADVITVVCDVRNQQEATTAV